MQGPAFFLGEGRRAPVAAILVLHMASAAIPQYVPGEEYLGRNGYVSYRAGDLPVIIDAPHGGRLTPSEIPNRTVGSLLSDFNTDSLAMAVAEALTAATGRHPHLVICRLHRVKLDCDRDIDTGAAGNAYAMQAWQEFHAFLDTSVAASTRDFGWGLYVDIHGHAHAIQRLEIGYGLTDTALSKTDAVLASYKNGSTIRALADSSDSLFGELVRGWSSLGGLLQTAGYPGLPSPQYPNPGGDPYFIGGYNADLYGAGSISSIHLECQYTGVRDTRANRLAFAQALAAAIIELLRVHGGMDLTAFSGGDGGRLRSLKPRRQDTSARGVARLRRDGAGGPTGISVEGKCTPASSTLGRVHSCDVNLPEIR